MSIAQVWLEGRRVGIRAASPLNTAAASIAASLAASVAFLRRSPRALFEYQP